MNGVTAYFKRDLLRFKEKMGDKWIDNVEYTFRDPDKNCGLAIGGMSTETRAAHSERGLTHKTEFFGLSSTAHAGSDEFHNFACSDYSGALSTLGQVGGRMKILGFTGTSPRPALAHRFLVSAHSPYICRVGHAAGENSYLRRNTPI